MAEKAYRKTSKPGRKVILWLLLILLVVLLVVGWRWHLFAKDLGESYQGPLPSPDRALEDLAEELKRDVVRLAGEIGERNLWHPEAYEAAANYIEEELRTAGYEVRRQAYEVRGQTSYNLEAILPGGDGKAIVVGAHYDSIQGSPGANDNASGVASMLALARRLADAQLEAPLRFVAFANEEPPFFQTPEMGSWVYAKELREEGVELQGMISLETMGYFSDQPGSQRFPAAVLASIYPDQGNFIGFVSDLGSAPWLKEVVGRFREHARFPSEWISFSDVLPGIGWSDHWAFWQEGYPGIMVTDTAPFRYPYYHLAEDTPDKIDYESLARITLGMESVLRDLGGRTVKTRK